MGRISLRPRIFPQTAIVKYKEKEQSIDVDVSLFFPFVLAL
jgi:hypothetical protein